MSSKPYYRQEDDQSYETCEEAVAASLRKGRGETILRASVVRRNNLNPWAIALDVGASVRWDPKWKWFRFKKGN